MAELGDTESSASYVRNIGESGAVFPIMAAGYLSGIIIDGTVGHGFANANKASGIDRQISTRRAEEYGLDQTSSILQANGVDGTSQDVIEHRTTEIHAEVKALQQDKGNTGNAEGYMLGAGAIGAIELPVVVWAGIRRHNQRGEKHREIKPVAAS